MAYAAVISLKKTVQHLLNSSHISIVLIHSSRQIMEHLYEEVCSLQEVLEKQQQRQVDLLELKQDVDSSIQMAKTMKADYRREIWNESPEEEDYDYGRFDGNGYSKMVGLTNQFIRIKDELTTNYSVRDTTSLVGMAGIGKTALAKKLFHDPLDWSHYETRAFVTMGPKRKLENVFLDILKQVSHDQFDGKLTFTERDQGKLHGLKMMMRNSLKDWKYLIALDDVWHNERFLSECFPDDTNGSRVLVTTRLPQSLTCLKFPYYMIWFLDKKESWDLLCEKVFGERESCSYELEKAGKKIAENCEGLPPQS
ncbi:PREDICTED: putative late blight resistance protein homolog R1B-17 [Erythranthe guttata]|uniref:putative late blight resistance protein homolog R1B-17 n=1 Tax=Erythranthe guttata TaxID=4155 RepID=UPI00064DA81C|nr:PREDICTED: putative late blight resistance protein homolog R1B-17 [Erythranthe guttata]|eukprot:XP_012853772.1 PREDICTED: putative late blight resistance protein homolog R1B-17 [Erythranthe guttata]